MADKSMNNIHKAGIKTEKVNFDVEKLIAWCQAGGYAVDGAACAQFAAGKLCQLHEKED